MLTSIHIQGFKGFKDTKIEPLRRVNLIVGGQNSGKTSLLEALYLSAFSSGSLAMNEFGSRLQHPGFRKSSAERQQRWVTNGVIKHPRFIVRKINHVSLDGVLDKDSEGFQVSAFSVYPREDSELVHLYDKAAFFKKKRLIIDLLKKIDDRVSEIENINSDGYGQSIHVDIGQERLIPISLLGQGFNKLAYLYSGLLGVKAEVGLIDELENGIHYSALPTVWQGIANIARELDIQLFITTHSKECIVAATEVFKDTPDEFQLIRLEREAVNVTAKCIPHDRVSNVLDMGLEVR